MAKSEQFTVSIEGIALTPQQRSGLNGAIQKAALSSLASLGVRAPFATHFPREWRGIWIGDLKVFNQKGIEAGLGGAIAKRR